MPRTDVITVKERQLLKCCYTARGLFALSAPDILSAHPVTFEGRTPQGIHQTAASLVRKGLLYRDPGWPVRYSITYAGIAAMRDEGHTPRRTCPGGFDYQGHVCDEDGCPPGYPRLASSGWVLHA